MGGTVGLQRGLLRAGPIRIDARIRAPEVAERLFAALADSLVSDGVPTDVLECSKRLGGGFDFAIFHHSQHRETANAVVNAVVNAINRRLLDTTPNDLHLHAGAASDDRGAVVVVGPSGAGKSTLVAALVAAGWSYGSDEMVRISSESSAVGAWPKPLTVKRSGHHVYEMLFGDAALSSWPVEADRWHIAASALGADVFDSHRVSRLAFVGERAQDRRDLSLAEAVVLLVEQCMDFDRFGPLGLVALARVVARSSIVTLARDDPRVMAATLARQEPRDRLPPVAQLRDRAGNEAVAIGGELVVRNRESGRVVSLAGQSASIVVDVHENESQPLGPSQRRFLGHLDSVLGEKPK